MNELTRFKTEESSSGQTLPLDAFSFSLPGPGPQNIPNKPLLEKQARNDELGLAQQKVAEELLDGEELKEFVKKRIDEEKEVFQHGARFLKGAQGAILHTEAGLARMTGNKEKADDIARYLADPARGKRLTHLQQMADKQGLGPELKEEIDTGFTGDVAEAFGQVGTQVGMVGTTGAINPKLGTLTLIGQVVGANYEGNYQRSKYERIEKELEGIENPEMLGEDGYKALLERVDEQANEDARNNLWTAIPEIALDKIFLGQAGKLLRGSAGTVKDKVATFTFGTLAEGMSEGTSALLQNYMVQRNIDPDQPLSENVLRDFALGVIVGGGTNLISFSVGDIQGAGEEELYNEITKLQKDIQKDLVVKAKELAKEGDPQAIKFLSDYKNVREQQIVNANTDTLKSVSVGVGETEVETRKTKVNVEWDDDKYFYFTHATDEVSLENIQKNGFDLRKSGGGIENSVIRHKNSADALARIQGKSDHKGHENYVVFRIEKSKHDKSFRDGGISDFTLDEGSTVVPNEFIAGFVSTSYKTTNKGMSVQEVKEALGKKGDQISTNLPIHVVDTMDNIGTVDENLQGKFSKDDQIEGLYVGANGDKKVILVADQLNNVDDVTRVLRHESIGHFGTEMVTGSMQEFFYSRVASDYINTELGQRIMRDYANDPNFNEIILGKEIVARVSENPDMAPLGLKQSLIDSFHKVTGNKVEQTPETDRQILKSITLADQLVTTPLLKRMEGSVTSADIDVQDSQEPLASRLGQPLINNGSLETIGEVYERLSFDESVFRADIAGETLQDKIKGIDENLSVQEEAFRNSTKLIIGIEGEDTTKFGPENYDTYMRHASVVDVKNNKLEENRDSLGRYELEEQVHPQLRGSLKNYGDKTLISVNTLGSGERGKTFFDNELNQKLNRVGKEVPRAGSDAVYQAILQEAHDKNYLYIPDQLSAINVVRTLGAMTSSALRNKSTSHFIPHVYHAQKVIPEGLESGIPHPFHDPNKPGTQYFDVLLFPDGYSWGENWKRDVGFLTTAEARLVDFELRKTETYRDEGLDNFHWDFNTGTIYYDASKSDRFAEGVRQTLFNAEAQPIENGFNEVFMKERDFIKDIVASENIFPARPGGTYGKNEGSGGIGASTFKRAVFAKSVKEQVEATGEAPKNKSSTPFVNILASRKQRTALRQKELKAGMTRDKNGNIFYKGKAPNDWLPQDFKEVGDLYGIKNFGGLTKLVDIKDPESGKTFKLPGGINGKFTYYDLLWIKANQPGIEGLSEGLHAKVTEKLAKSLTPEKVDKVEQFNRLAFGFLSPNAPLLPNEFGVARIFSQSMDDIKALAKLGESYPKSANTEGMTVAQAKSARAKVSAQRSVWNKKVKKLFDIGSRGDGGVGIGLTQDFGRLANFARLYVKNPDFFVKKADEDWSFFVDRMASQVSGFGTKTASFGGVWQDPFNAMISAIDRHMASNFAEKVIKDPELKERFGSTIVTKFNKELGKAREKRDAHRKKLKSIDAKLKKDLAKAKTDTAKVKANDSHTKAKIKAEADYADTLESGMDPSLREVKTLDGVMAQVDRLGYDRVSKALGKATFETMSAVKRKFKDPQGNPSKSVKGTEFELYDSFIENPEQLKLMSEPYRKALEVNEQKAEQYGIPIFPAQWTLWDRIRQRIEPHEVMFPGLHKLPRMGREQIARSFNASSNAGYAVAPQPIENSGLEPQSLVYFSKKSGSADPITGESKFGIRLQYDETLPKPFRENLDVLYQVQTHQEVLDSLRPWLRARKNKNYEQMASEIVNMDNPDLTPEQKVLLGQILIKRLGVESDALRAKMLDKKKKGQAEFDFESTSIDLNRKDKMALDLADNLMEYGRTLGRGVSLFQAFSAMTPRGRIRFAKRQMQRVVKAKVEAKSPDMERVASVLDDIIKIAQQAGFDALSLEFFRKRKPNLLKLIEDKYPPSLWGAYRKESVNKLHSAIMAKYNETGEQAGPTKTPLARFVNELVSEIKSRTDLNPQAKAGEERSVSQVLRDALLNSEKYAEVWHEFAKRTMSDKRLTDEQRAELETFFGEIPKDPSQKIVRTTLQERMKKFDMKLQLIARQNMTKREGQANTLVPALMEELELPRDIANQLAIQMKSEFNLMVKEEAKKQLDAFKKKDLMPKIERVTKGSEQFIIEMANLGAFDRSDLYDALGKRLGVKGFDRAFAQKVKKVADEIEKTPEGFQRNDKITDLMNLIQNQAGDGRVALLMAIRVANLVSGVSTQLVNLTGNLSTAVPMAGTHIIRSGFDPNIGYRVAVNMLHGFGKGLDEAKSVMMTGRGRAGYEMTKYSFDPILERKTLPGGNLNPYNYLKYVHRFMSAMDMAFRFANTEGKATLLAGLEAKGMGLKGKAKRDYIQKALKLDGKNVETAVAQASAEGLSGLNHRRRVNEILENRRDPDLKEESEQYGLRSTYQNVPEGALGVAASAIAQFNYPNQIPGQYVPPMRQLMAGVGQFFIPFIRVVANVQNMMFDYTPGIGLARVGLHKSGLNVVRTKGKPASDEMIKDMATRQLIGTALSGVLGYLFFSEEEDEENRLFDITAGGPKNYQKKKTLMEAGYKPYTVRMFGVDIGYKETPFGGMLAFMGGIKDQIKYEDEPLDIASATLAGFMAFGRISYDQAFFKGASDFIDIAKADEQSASAMKRMVRSGGQSFVVPNLFNQIDNALSNRRYDTGQMDSALSHYFLPLVPFAKNLGMPNLTVFGEPAERHTEGFINGLFDRVVRAQKTDPLLEKLVNKGIIPVKPNAGQLIRGEEEDEALSTRHREQDLYLFNEIKGRHYRRFLDNYDKSGQKDGIESRLNRLTKQSAQHINQQLISASAKIARARVRAMDRDEVERRLRMIKRKFDGPLAK